MCEKGYSMWPNSITCQAPFGYCSTANEQSPSPNSSGNISAYICVCSEGFAHDLAILRFRDCRLPIYFYRVIDGLVAALAFLAFLYSMYYLRNAKSLARYIISSTIGLELSLFFLGALRFVNDHKMVAGTVFLFYSCVTFACLCLYLTSYSMAYPLYTMSRLSVDKMVFTIRFSFVLFRVIGFIPIIIVAVLFNDYNDERNDRGWNISAAIDSTIFGLEMTAIIVSTVIHGFQMIGTINNISKNLPDSSTRAASTDDYLKRVRSFLNFQMYFAPIVTILSFSLPVIYFSSGYVPYVFAMFASAQFSALIFTIVQTRFTVSNKIDQSSHPSNDATSGNMITPSASNQNIVMMSRSSFAR